MRMLFGVLLMIVGFVALFAVVILPVIPSTEDNVSINNYLQTLLCEPGEKFVREQYQTRDNDGTNYSMTPYCINSERQRQDVTEKWIMIGIVGFIVPFLIGIFVTIAAGTSMARRRSAEIFQSYASRYGVTDVVGFNSDSGNLKNFSIDEGVIRVNGAEIKMNGLTPEKVRELKAQMQSAGSGDLTAKLRQLQDAKDKGLISADEYDRVRQRILDDIT